MSRSLRHDVAEQLKVHPSNKRNFQTAHTASYTLRVQESGSTHTNLGAGSGITFTLPQSSATKGCNFTIVVQTAQTVTIDPSTAGAIYIGGAKQTDSEDLSSANIGDSITLESDGNGDWVVTARQGSWGQAFAGSVQFTGTVTEPALVLTTSALTLSGSVHGGKHLLFTSTAGSRHKRLTLPLPANVSSGTVFKIHNGVGTLTSWGISVIPTSNTTLNGTTNIFKSGSLAARGATCEITKINGQYFVTASYPGRAVQTSRVWVNAN